MNIYARFKKWILNRRRSVLNLHAIRILQENHELWDTLSGFLEKSSSTGCSYSDYLILYAYIKEKKPSEILECGSGVSTVVIAHALMENEKESGIFGRVTSMEELPEWYESVKQLFPEHLKKYTDLILSPVTEGRYALFRGMRYEKTPDRPYELVFVDGPKTSSPEEMANCSFLGSLFIFKVSNISVYIFSTPSFPSKKRIFVCLSIPLVMRKRGMSPRRSVTDSSK